MGDDFGEEWWEQGDEPDVSDDDDDDDDVEKKEEGKDLRKQASPRKRKQQPVDVKSSKVKKKKQPKECFLARTEEDGSTTEGPKKRKRRRKKKISDVLESKPATPDDLRKLLVKCLKDKRSVIEMEERSLPDSCFLPSNDLTHSLASYLKESCPKWAKLCRSHKEEKSVLMLIVCSSAHRVLELIRLLTAFKGNCKVLKLFAKHIKVEEQIKWLEKGINYLGVGTPGRIKTLIEQDGLSLKSLKYVIFDWNWRDQKLRRMMDIPEIQLDVIKLLETGIIAACRAGSMKLGLF